VSPAPQNRLTGTLDGALHLLDRQILDSEGRMLGKVDDVELTQRDDGLAVTAVLTGSASLLRRLGARMGTTMATRYVQLRPAEPDRGRPWRVTMDQVDRLDSALHLLVRRAGVLRRDREAWRFGHLTGMDVLDADGSRIGLVLDARFSPAADGMLVLRSLLVGRGRPGSLLGYDRREGQGPWLVRVVVRWLHRHTATVDIADASILWNRAEVRLNAGAVFGTALFEPSDTHHPEERR
jgi:sporulation protein YlmC with PRC-barrel domain